MKEISDLNFPDDLKYSSDHEWVQTQGDRFRIGISDYAQDQLGDIVFVELPEEGASVSKGEEFGTVESVKAVSELYMPVSGKIISVNPALEENPELINTNPYDDGWMVEVKPSDPSETETLMEKDFYVTFVKEAQ